MKRLRDTHPRIPAVPQQRNGTGTSVLFALEPRGLGTAQVEGLTGYVRRLAATHVRRHGILLDRLILDPHRLAHPQDAGFLWAMCSISQAFNGATRMGALVTGHLEALTCVPTVRRTTLFERSDALWVQGALRQHRAWCPLCLEADGAEPYDRLLWSLRTSTVCVVHECALLDACPRCSATRTPLRADVRETVCSACGTSLVDGVSRRRVPVDAYSQLAHDFIARLETVGPATHVEIVNGISALVQRYGSWHKLKVDAHGRDTAWHSLVRGRSLGLELDSLFDAALLAGEDLATFLSHPPVELRRIKPTPSFAKPHRSTLKKRTAALDALAAVIADPQAAPTVREFTVKHNVSREWISAARPDLYAELVARGKRRRRARKNARIQSEIALIDAEVRALHLRFGELTWNQLNDHLSEPGRMRNPRIRAHADQLMTELNAQVRRTP